MTRALELLDVLLLAAAAPAAVLWAVVSLRRRSVAVGRERVVLAAAAGAAIVFALHGPPDRLAGELLAAHMLQHVMLGDIAAVLLVLALRGPVLEALVPSPPAALRRLLDLVFRPVPALLAWVGALAGWHVPWLYDLALRHETLHALEHLSFLLTGLLVWTQLIDPAGRGRLTGWSRFAYAVALLAVAQALGNVLVLSYRPLYDAYGSAEAPFGLSPIADQNAAAAVMMVEQMLTFGVFALLVARRLIGGTEPRPGKHHPLAT